jgi:hypothetical protein
LLDPEEVANRVTSRTHAVIPVHLYGQPADMNFLNRSDGRSRHSRDSRRLPSAMAGLSMGAPLRHSPSLWLIVFIPRRTLAASEMAAPS